MRAAGPPAIATAPLKAVSLSLALIAIALPAPALPGTLPKTLPGTLPGATGAGIEVIRLSHRTARALLPLLRPLLPRGTALSGRGHTLLLRAAPAERARIRALARRLDTPRPRLLISIRPRPRVTPAGDIVRYDVGGPAAGTHAGRARTYEVEPDDYAAGRESVATLDGRPAHLEIGRRLVRVEGPVWVAPDTVTLTGAIPPGPPGAVPIVVPLRLRRVASGFDVVAHAHGDEVVLSVRAYRARTDSAGGGPIAYARVAATVRGRLGQWIDLGGIGAGARAAAGTRSYSTQPVDTGPRGFQIRVDRLPAATASPLAPPDP